MKKELILKGICLVFLLCLILTVPVSAGTPWFAPTESPESWSPESRNISWVPGQNWAYHNATHNGYYICGWKTLTYYSIPDFNCLGAGYTTDGTVRSFYSDWAGINSSSGFTMFGCVKHTTSWDAVIAWNVSGISDNDPPVANFTGSPRYGFAPLSVVLNDTSSNTPTSWYWIASMAGTTYTSTTKNWSLSLGVGNWGVNLTAYNSWGNSTISRAAYFEVSGGAGNYTVVNLDIKNSQTGALVQDATCGIRNTTSGIWRNTTAPTGLIYYDATGTAWEYPLSVGQLITLAAGGTGYKPSFVNLTIPYSNYRQVLYLVPSSIVNATGTFTLVVSTVADKTGVQISGASVVLDTGQMQSTNSAGVTTFYNVTAGSRTITVSTPTYGYLTTSQIITGIAGETRLITFRLIMVGETPVTTFISPTPTGTGAGNYSPSALNERGSAGLAGMIDSLIDLWPLFLLGILYLFWRRVTEK